MSILEDKIRKNPESFNTREPAEGHFDRFRDRLDSLHGMESKERPLVWFRAIKIAAAILVLAALSGLLIFLLQGEKNQALAAGLPPELQNAKMYYEFKAEEKLDKISQCSLSEEQAAELTEMARTELDIIDRQGAELAKEYRTNPGNEHMEKALIENFKTKNEILDNILNRLCKL